LKNIKLAFFVLFSLVFGLYTYGAPTADISKNENTKGDIKTEIKEYIYNQ